MLAKKMLRDIAKHKAQFISIFLMAFLGVFVFAGVGGESVGLEVNVNDFYLKNARIPQLLQVVDELHYWVYYLFLINFIFILCFLVAFLGRVFLFSILFLWIFDNCFEYENCSEFVIRILFKCYLLFFI